MPRYRSVKPEFWSDGNMRRLSDSCALFYIALWNFCDDEGKIRNDPQQIASQVARWRSDKVRVYLRLLSDHGRLQVSSCSEWVRVVAWFHQKINRPIQPICKSSEIQWMPRRASLSQMDLFTEHSLQGEERRGEERRGEERNAEPPPENPGDGGPTEIRESAEIHPIAIVWNTEAAKIPAERGALPRVMKTTGPRLTRCETLWREHPDIGYWSTLFVAICSSDFLIGHNDSSWVATLDWILKGSNRDKVLEGNYANRKSKTAGGGGGYPGRAAKRQQNNLDVLERSKKQREGEQGHEEN